MLQIFSPSYRNNFQKLFYLSALAADQLQVGTYWQHWGHWVNISALSSAGPIQFSLDIAQNPWWTGSLDGHQWRNACHQGRGAVAQVQSWISGKVLLQESFPSKIGFTSGVPLSLVLKQDWVSLLELFSFTLPNFVFHGLDYVISGLRDNRQVLTMQKCLFAVWSIAGAWQQDAPALPELKILAAEVLTFSQK